jgi:DNA transformation protein
MGELAKLPNVGKVLEKNLNDIGVFTEAQLKEVGVKQAFLRIRLAVDPGACLHMLYGLQGAADGVKDSLLPESTKQDLKAFFKSL